MSEKNPPKLSFTPQDIRKKTTFHGVDFTQSAVTTSPTTDLPLLRLIGKKIGDQVTKALKLKQTEIAEIGERIKTLTPEEDQKKLREIHEQIADLETKIQRLYQEQSQIDEEIDTIILCIQTASEPKLTASELEKLLHHGKEYAERRKCLSEKISEVKKTLTEKLEAKSEAQKKVDLPKQLANEITERQRFIREFPSVLQEILSGKIPLSTLLK